jgi:hypothetical protein
VLEVVAVDRAVEFVFGAGLQAVLDMTVKLREVEEDHT